jgi:hypothetical protein
MVVTRKREKNQIVKYVCRQRWWLTPIILAIQKCWVWGPKGQMSEYPSPHGEALWALHPEELLNLHSCTLWRRYRVS